MNIKNSTNVTPLASNYFRSITSQSTTAAQNIKERSVQRNTAAKDPSGMTISQKMMSQMTGISAASRNVQDAVSMVQTAGGVLSQASNVLNRMGELTAKAGNGILGTQERDVLQQEFNQLSSELDRMGKSSNFNGNPIFDGSTYTMLVGETADDTLDIEFSTLSSASLGLNNVDLSSADSASKGMELIRDASKKISYQQSTIGAAENGMQSVFNQLDNKEYNLAQSLSNIMDTDIGKESINQSISKTLNQVSISMMKNSQNLINYNALQLLLK